VRDQENLICRLPRVGLTGGSASRREGIVDSLSRKLLEELEEMQQRTGRMLRNMSMGRIMTMESGSWQPPVDIYESEDEYYVYFDLAGADAQTFSVIVDGHQVRVHGKRELPPHKSIACVHQLEIELGMFDRTVALPGPIDVDSTSSSYTNGILTITLPKKQNRGKVNIHISQGGE